jgi:hypothetical protein
MSAGLPGLGLGGLFFIFSALIAPFFEFIRTVRGESDAASWRRVGRNFALAVAMIVAVDGALRLAYLGIDLTGLGDPATEAPTVLPLVPIAITVGLLAAVLGSAKAMQLAAFARSRGIPPLPVPTPWPGRRRALAGGVAVTAGWFVLLLFGASQLSPVSDTESTPAVAAGLDQGEAPGSGPLGGRTSVARTLDRRGETGGAPVTQRRPRAPDSVLAASSISATAPPSTDTPAGATTGTPHQPTAPVGSTSAPPPEETDPEPAGPLSDAGPDSAAGPPEHAAAGADAGPPDHAGPPEHAGPPAKDYQTVGSTRNSIRVP